MPQDLSQCKCEEPPVQPPPGGNNYVAPQVAGECFRVPTPPGGGGSGDPVNSGDQLNSGLKDPFIHIGGGGGGGLGDPPGGGGPGFPKPAFPAGFDPTQGSTNSLGVVKPITGGSTGTTGGVGLLKPITGGGVPTNDPVGTVPPVPTVIGNNGPSLDKIPPTDPLGTLSSGNVPSNIPSVAMPVNEPGLGRLPMYPVEDEFFDPEHNLFITQDQQFLAFANTQAPNPVYSSNGILKEQISSAVTEILSPGAQYSGLAISNVVYNTKLIPESITEGVAAKLAEAEKYNVVSTRASNLLRESLRRSIILGTIDGYGQDILDEIIATGKTYFPNGIPEYPEGYAGGERMAYSIVRNSGAPVLFPTNYQNGDTKREIQRWRPVPKDIDMTAAVRLKSGKLTGVRVRNDDGLTVRKRVERGSGTELDSIYQLNDFVKVRKVDQSIVGVGMNSHRDIAHVVPAPHETMVQGFIEGSDYTPELIVSSTTYGGSGSVEMSGEGLAIPSMMLFSSVRTSIKDLPRTNPNLQSTLVDYELAWDSLQNDSYEAFDTTVSSWSGPRLSIYIDYRDPIWNYLLERNPVQLRLNDFVRSLDGKLHVRKVFTDFAIYPTNLVKYAPYQGRSTLTTFSPTEYSVRTLQVFSNPLGSVANEDYVQSEKTADGKSPSRETDNYAFGYAARSAIVQQAAELHGTSASFTTVKSPLGKVFDRVKEIDDNYNIIDSFRGKRIPQPDVFFNMTAGEVAEFYSFVPADVKSSLFAGAYNDIEVFPVEKTAQEKTFLTSERLTGTPLTNKIQSTAVPMSQYIPNIYRGRLYGDE